MLGNLLLAAALSCVGCATAGVREPDAVAALAPATEREVRSLLDDLYRTFNYAAGQEPDWTGMRSCFVDGALFAPEPDPGEPVRAFNVDSLIAKWQGSMRKRQRENAGYAEWIDSVRYSRVGGLVRADVSFYGKEPTDRHERKAGLDTLQLVEVDGAWKVLSFVVLYESKL